MLCKTEWLWGLRTWLHTPRLIYLIFYLLLATTSVGNKQGYNKWEFKFWSQGFATKATYTGTHRGALYYCINMIGKTSAFAISFTVVRLPIFVKCLWSWSAGCTPSAILNTKHTVTCSYCSYRTLGNCIFSNSVVSVQNRIPPLQGWNCAIAGISVASNAIISWKMEFALVLMNNQKIRKKCLTEFMTLADYVIPRN